MNIILERKLVILLLIFLFFNISSCNKINKKQSISELKVNYYMQPIIDYYTSTQFQISYKFLNKNFNENIYFKLSKTEVSPLFFCPIEVFDQKYYIILDAQNQLWINNKPIFNDTTSRQTLITKTDWQLMKKSLISFIKESTSSSAINLYPSTFIKPIIKEYNINTLLSSNYINLEFDSIGQNNIVINRLNLIDKHANSCYFISITFSETTYPEFVYRHKTDSIIPFLIIVSYKLDY